MADLPPLDSALSEIAKGGRVEARYLAFLETISHLRPSLHRYCARMTGSALDGEDVAQEALFQAYRKLDTFDDKRPLAPWLFRIAHNRCIDFLRQRGTREQAEAEAEADASLTEADVTAPSEPDSPLLGKAVEHLVSILPPKERASVLLKDVFDYSLEEIAELVDSTVGGVKAALNRGRAKLAEQPLPSPAARARSNEDAVLLRLYVERFNQRDWTGLQELISADARLLVADRFFGSLSDAPYFGTYDRMPVSWRMALGEIDDETVVIIQRAQDQGWSATGVVRFQVSAGRIVDIRDYWYCPWILSSAAQLVIEGAA